MTSSALPDSPWLRDEFRPSADEVEPLAWIVWAYERRPPDDFERCRDEVEMHLWASRCAEKHPRSRPEPRKRPPGT